MESVLSALNDETSRAADVVGRDTLATPTACWDVEAQEQSTEPHTVSNQAD